MIVDLSVTRLLFGAACAWLSDEEDSASRPARRRRSHGRPGQLTVIVVPGFLTESSVDGKGCRSRPRGGSQADWHAAGRAVAPMGAQVTSFNWHSGAPVDLVAGPGVGGGPLFGLGGLGALYGGAAANAFLAFRRALDEADAAIEELGEEVAACAGPVAIVGHSLGGRIALRYAEAAGRGEVPGVRSVHSLAAAISPDDLDWDDVASGVERRPVVAFSREDLVLRSVYRAGALELGEPVGLAGPPRDAPVSRRDLSALGLGHLDYVSELPACVKSQEIGGAKRTKRGH